MAQKNREDHATPPPTAGDLIREMFLPDFGITQTQLAEALAVSYQTVSSIINGHSRVTPEMAIRLGTVFGTSPEYWLNAQRGTDLYELKNSPRNRQILAKVKPLVSVR